MATTSDPDSHVVVVASRRIEDGEYFTGTTNRVDVHFMHGGLAWELVCHVAPNWFLELSPYSYARSYSYLQIWKRINNLPGIRFPSTRVTDDGKFVIELYTEPDFDLNDDLLRVIDQILDEELYARDPQHKEKP